MCPAPRCKQWNILRPQWLMSKAICLRRERIYLSKWSLCIALALAPQCLMSLVFIKQMPAAANQPSAWQDQTAHHGRPVPRTSTGCLLHTCLAYHLHAKKAKHPLFKLNFGRWTPLLLELDVGLKSKWWTRGEMLFSPTPDAPPPRHRSNSSAPPPTIIRQERSCG